MSWYFGVADAYCYGNQYLTNTVHVYLFLLPSLKNETPVLNHKPESSTEENEEASIQEPEETMSLFEMPAQTSKGNAATAGLISYL